MFEVKDKRNARLVLMLCLMACIAFFIFTARTIIIYTSEAKDMNSSEFDIKSHGTGGHVSSNITQVYGHQEHRYRKYNSNDDYRDRKVVYTDFYYYIPVNGKNGETCYICVNYPKNQDMDIMEVVTKFNSASGTGGLRATNSMYIDGTIEKLDSTVYNKMVQDFVDAGIFANQYQAKKYVLPYVLESSAKYSWLLSVSIAIVLFIGTIIAYISYRKAVRKSMIKTGVDVVANSATEVKIGSITVKPGHLDYINEYIAKGRDDIAVEELQEKYGLDVAEAQNIVNDWYAYYK